MEYPDRSLGTAQSAKLFSLSYCFMPCCWVYQSLNGAVSSRNTIFSIAKPINRKTVICIPNTLFCRSPPESPMAWIIRPVINTSPNKWISIFGAPFNSSINNNKSVIGIYSNALAWARIATWSSSFPPSPSDIRYFLRSLMTEMESLTINKTASDAYIDVIIISSNCGYHQAVRSLQFRPRHCTKVNKDSDDNHFGLPYPRFRSITLSHKAFQNCLPGTEFPWFLKRQHR